MPLLIRSPIKQRRLSSHPAIQTAHWTPADSLASANSSLSIFSNIWQLDVMRGAMMSLPKEKRERCCLRHQRLT